MCIGTIWDLNPRPKRDARLGSRSKKTNLKRWDFRLMDEVSKMIHIQKQKYDKITLKEIFHKV